MHACRFHAIKAGDAKYSLEGGFDATVTVPNDSNTKDVSF